MSYDEDLADRVRELLPPDPPVTEQKMFGGLAFLVGGNMALAVSSKGGLLVRVDPEQADRLLRTTPAEVMVMRGRPMEGWLRVASEEVRTRRQLERWVTIGAAFGASLPAKIAVRSRRGR